MTNVGDFDGPPQAPTATRSNVVRVDAAHAAHVAGRLQRVTLLRSGSRVEMAVRDTASHRLSPASARNSALLKVSIALSKYG
jgi:hypothetical protein